MVRVAIQRLIIDVGDIQRQNVPFVTGPGAVKSAMVSVVKLVLCINVPMHAKGNRTYTLHHIIHNGI